MSEQRAIREAFERGKGIFRLAPVFVPRRFSQAGRRLRLHPDDYYALGTARGSIKERWFSSVIPAMNGPLAPAGRGHELRGRRATGHEDKFTLQDAVEELGAELIGEELMAEVRHLADVLEVLRLRGAAVPPPAPGLTSAAAGGTHRQAGGATTSRRSSTTTWARSRPPTSASTRT